MSLPTMVLGVPKKQNEPVASNLVRCSQAAALRSLSPISFFQLSSTDPAPHQTWQTGGGQEVLPIVLIVRLKPRWGSPGRLADGKVVSRPAIS